MSQKKIIRICAIVSGLSGLIILFSTLYPIVSYEWESAQRYPILLSPLVDEEKGKFSFDKRDFTKASNWFDEVPKKEERVESGVTFFTLTVPKLKIDNASVKIGGEDLSDYLIQFPGTALPGRNGNTVIFGHSVLPIYFNPEDYLTIFSTLPKLSKGDMLYVNYDGISYRYEVEDLFEVKPSDVQILQQDTSDSFLSLVTCTPPGHPLKPRRLIVRARIMTDSAATRVENGSYANIRN
jgi:sortase A